MTTPPTAGSLSARPWGYLPESGYWSIDLSIPADAVSLNGSTLSCLQHFFDAFSGLCRPVEIRLDLMHFSPEGRLAEVEEGKKISAPQKDAALLMQVLRPEFDVVHAPFISALFLDVDIWVEVPEAVGGEEARWMAKAGSFYIGYVLNPDDQDQLQAEDGSASFGTDIDVWLEKTLDPDSTAYRDNRAYAILNNPRLTHALRTWQLIQSEVVDLGSKYYRKEVSKDGFEQGSS